MRRPRSSATGIDLRAGHVVVAGGGPAAVAAVEELRALGFGGNITVLCGEATGPYDRTVCSKGIVDGRQQPTDARLAMPAGAQWRLGERAIRLDTDTRVVTGSSGESYRYDGLVVATGTRSDIPEGWPLDESGVYQLRTLNDAWAVRRALRHADKVAVIGGGLTGCEVACGVLQAAREVVLVDPNRVLLQRSVGEKLGNLVTTEHRDAGIELLLGASVLGVGRRRGRFRLQLDDGNQVSADLVVIATGQLPDTDWLDGAGFDLSDGVLCDEALRVVGGDGTVVAAGSVARWPDGVGELPARYGQWIAATEQGCAAARTLLAGPDADPPPTRVLPRYSSHQYRLRIQVAGWLAGADEVRLTRTRQGRHSPVRSGAVATYHRAGRLTGVAAVNAPAAFAVELRGLVGADGLPVPAAAEAAGDAGEVPASGSRVGARHRLSVDDLIGV